MEHLSLHQVASSFTLTQLENNLYQDRSRRDDVPSLSTILIFSKTCHLCRSLTQNGLQLGIDASKICIVVPASNLLNRETNSHVVEDSRIDTSDDTQHANTDYEEYFLVLRRYAEVTYFYKPILQDSV